MMLVSAFAGPYFTYGLINIGNLFYDITNMYGFIINVCNLMILQRILDVINFNNPISLFFVLGGLGECDQQLSHKRNCARYVHLVQYMAGIFCAFLFLFFMYVFVCWKQEESARERALCQLTECF